MQEIRIFGKKINVGYLFSSPGVLFFMLMAVYPAAFVIYLAFFSSGKGIAIDPSFIGFENFAKVFSNARFWQMTLQSFEYAGAVMLLNLSIGLILAVLLNQKCLNVRYLRIMRTIVLVSWALSPTVVAVMAKVMLHPQIGPIAQILQKLGSDIVFDPLGNPDTALLTIILTNVYMYMPFYFLSLLAALQAINENLYEAATIDGATGMQQFRYVTLPILKNNLLTLMLFNFCATFTYMDLTWIMTEGGPLYSTEVLATYAYRTAFKGYQFGQAAAIGVIMFIIAVVFSVIVLRHMKKE